VKGNGITMAPRLRPALLIVLALLLAACGQTTSTTFSSIGETLSHPPAPASSAPSSPAYPLSVTDDAGRSVSLASEPVRIVSLAPSNTEVVCALGACNELVGVTDFDDYPPQVADVPKVVVQAVPDIEKIVAAEPDLVLAAGNQQTPQAALDQLDELKIPYLVLYPETLDAIYADIELVGAALGASDEAATLTAEMRQKAQAVQDAVAGADRPSVFYEVSVYQGVIYGAGSDSFLASMIELAGGEPVVGDATGVIQLEDLVEADPGLILLGDAAYPPPVTAADVAARPGWEKLGAVANGKVIPMRQDVVITRPGPRIVDGLEALAQAIHPDLFDS
jgi:iron complex transport system substrate-binding protein